MARHQRILIVSIIAALFLIVLVAILNPVLNGTPGARGKSPAQAIEEHLDEAQHLAQDLALSHAEVQALTVGRRSEVFGVRSVGDHFTPESSACAEATCYQVEIYNFNENEAVVAIVDVDHQAVLDVMHQPGVRPGINKRLADLAYEIVTTHPDVLEVLGDDLPAQEDLYFGDSSLANSACEQGHLCVAPTFEVDRRIMWAVVDLTEERLAGITFTGASEGPDDSVLFSPAGCPSPGTTERDGWSLSYETTGSDGLRVYNATYNGVPVLTSVKLVQWHADYGNTGYQDSTGCGGGGGGFPIYPYGETQVLDLYPEPGAGPDPIGFEVVQDFRMGNWGQDCNYRYEQHLRFYTDGSFQVLGASYGKGCGPTALYRPLVRIDVAVAGDHGDSFYRWRDGAWEKLTTEFYLVPYDEAVTGPHEFDPEGFSWMVRDASGAAFKIQQKTEGVPDDWDRDDYPFVYAVQHHSSEGDSDLGVIGVPYQDDHQQGPEQYVNGESIDGQNLVLWYLPQLVTEASQGSYYCWTVSGGSNPETYPCFGGPLFVPPPLEAGFASSEPAGVGETVVFTNTSTGPPPLSYLWDFGDGSGTATSQNPTHVYDTVGDYVVNLTVSNPQGSDIYTDTVSVGIAAVAGFTSNSPISVTQTAVFTNTSTGTPQVYFVWDFDDGSPVSTEPEPTHLFASMGIYTVTLTASNLYGSDVYKAPLAVGIAPLAKFSVEPPALTGIPVQFANKTIGGKSYSWDFGDGSASSEANPSHVFASAGTYTVTLTATNQFGDSEFSLQVTVSDPKFILIPLARREP